MNTTPRTVRFPDDWWSAIEAEAQRSNQTASEWIVLAAGKTLPKSVRRKLSKPRGRGRPPQKNESP